MKKCKICLFINKKNEKCSITNEKHYELGEKNKCMSFTGHTTLNKILSEKLILEKSLFDLLTEEQQLARLKELVFENDSLRERIKGLVPLIREELKQKGVFG